MYLILLFCVKVSFLHLCVANLEYHCTKDPRQPPEIILLETKYNDAHTLLNRKFMETCSEFYKIRHRYINDGIGIYETLKTIEEFNDITVINLYLPDYYKYTTDNGEVEEKLEYAGDLINTTQTCVVSNETKSHRDCGEVVKVISKTGMTEELFDFVDSIQIIDGRVDAREHCLSALENMGDLKTVLVCVEDNIDTHIQIHIDPLKLLIRQINYCEAYIEYFPSILTVLAPKPFKMDTEYSVPVVFYKTPYICPKLGSTFLNSMTLSKWQPLKHVILKFLNLMGWQRVAIVSDNAFYSIEFESELTALFDKEKILYAVTRCEETNCDVTKTMLSLWQFRAKIVFVNLEENNAQNLIQYASYLPNFVWLLREHSDAIKVTDRQRVFTFSFGASVEQATNCGLNENILDGLNSISQTYKFMEYRHYGMSKAEFYSPPDDHKDVDLWMCSSGYVISIYKNKQFLKVIKMKRPPDAIAYVDKLNSRGSEPISSMHVTDDGVKVITFEDPYKDGHKPMDAPACLARSHNYFKPCENTLVLLFMFVIILFSTTVLLITCYFHKSSPFHDIRYQNFR